MAGSGSNVTGYGPSSSAMGRWNRLYFDGDERKYEQWEIKLLGYMRIQKLKDRRILFYPQTRNLMLKRTKKRLLN